MCVERMEGVLIMAANTNALPRIDMSISGTLRTQFIMVTVSGVKLSSLIECWSAILKLKSDQLIFPYVLVSSENFKEMWRRQYREKITAQINHQNTCRSSFAVTVGRVHYKGGSI